MNFPRGYFFLIQGTCSNQILKCKIKYFVQKGKKKTQYHKSWTKP